VGSGAFGRSGGLRRCAPRRVGPRRVFAVFVLGAVHAVHGPVLLLAAVVAIRGVPAAVEERFLQAEGAPLFAFRRDDGGFFLLQRQRCPSCHSFLDSQNLLRFKHLLDFFHYQGWNTDEAIAFTRL